MDAPGAEPPALSPATVTVEHVPSEGTRFRVEVAGYDGPLDELVRRAQQGEVDLSAVSVASITDGFRRLVEADPAGAQLQDIADFLTLAARLVALKAAAVLPDAQATDEPEEEGAVPDEDETVRRLAEYWRFKAAADALLSGAAEEGARSFLGLVSPEVIPVERMRIPPERLAAAFRAVLERLEEEQLPVGVATFSVEEKMAELRERLQGGLLRFEEIFSGVATRLEAVACFLALLELLRRGEATVDQEAPFGPITVTRNG